MCWPSLRGEVGLVVRFLASSYAAVRSNFRRSSPARCFSADVRYSKSSCSFWGIGSRTWQPVRFLCQFPPHGLRTCVSLPAAERLCSANLKRSGARELLALVAVFTALLITLCCFFFLVSRLLVGAPRASYTNPAWRAGGCWVGSALSLSCHSWRLHAAASGHDRLVCSSPGVCVPPSTFPASRAPRRVVPKR